MLAEPNNYQRAFMHIPEDLAQVDVAGLCNAYGISHEDFGKYVAACPVRKAKWNEVFESVQAEKMKKVK
jgi:menaquinone-dependent protoporphyrinogen IX oxidase